MKTSDVEVRLRRPHSDDLLEQHVLTSGDSGFAVSFETPRGEQFVLEAIYRGRDQEATEATPAAQPACGDDPRTCRVDARECRRVCRPTWPAFQDSNGAQLDLTPTEALKRAVEAATAALDRAHATGVKMPWASQAAGAVAVLDTAAKMLGQALDT